MERTEDELGPIGDPFHERVHDDQAQRASPEEDRVPIKLNEDRQADAQLGRQPDHRSRRRDLSARQRSVLCPFDQSVVLAVPEVVDRTSGSAHDDGTGEEEEGLGNEDGGRKGVGSAG